MAEQLKEDQVRRVATAKVRAAGLAFKPKSYEFDDSFKASNLTNALDVHTVPEMIAFLHKESKTEIEGSYLQATAHGLERRSFRNRETFLKQVRRSSDKIQKMREFDSGWGFGNLVGNESLPLLGGPFHKQLYMRDYLRMNAACFYAYNHDPAAKRAVQIVTDFTLGRGLRIDCDDPYALSIIRAWEEVNDLPEMAEAMANEIQIYGEVMCWELPNGDTKIVYDVRPGQIPPKGLIPRYRWIDPSCIWEIVTYPEDITRKLFYQWCSPTQYQIYTGSDQGAPVPGSKFIFQQIPAEQVLHYKINAVSNEKRGRSDLFPVLGYMKRLRDSVNYSIIAMQKQAAWAIDTTIEGSQADIDNYIAAVAAEGAIAEAGSEFVHTSAVKREFLANTAGKAGGQDAFDWCLSMIAMGTGIPLQYFGTHLSNAGTRASALVATEPVAKRFERRQRLYERVIRDMLRRTLDRFGVSKQVEFEITFPEIVTQDRAAKLKDIANAQANGWISRRRAAEIAAKELGITKYDYKQENAEIESEASDAFATASMTNPLTAPGTVQDSAEPTDEAQGISSKDREDITKNDRTL